MSIQSHRAYLGNPMRKDEWVAKGELTIFQSAESEKMRGKDETPRRIASTGDRYVEPTNRQ